MRLLGPFCIQPNSVQDSMAAGVTLMRAKAPPVTPHKQQRGFLLLWKFGNNGYIRCAYVMGGYKTPPAPVRDTLYDTLVSSPTPFVEV